MRVDSAAFAAKFQSKREVFRFLTHDLGAYLSTYETMTIFHMRDLVSGDRKRIKAIDVKTITVPHFERLKIETMLEFGGQYRDVVEALPEIRRDVDKLPRAYIANVIYTLVGEPFRDWVEDRVNERHELRRK